MKEYFALKPSEEFIKDAMGYNTTWQNVISAGTQGIAAVWYRNLRYYYGAVIDGAGYDSSLDFAGEEGELVKMLVPQARSLNQQFLSITTKQKLYFDPLADSSDADTLDTTRLCKGVIQDVLRTQKLDMKGYRLAELATLTGISYIWPNWDFMRGRPTGVAEDGELLFSGMPSSDVLLPTDVVFDVTCENFYDLDWVLIRKRANRYDLMRKYPSLEEEIRSLPEIAGTPDNTMFFYDAYNKDYVWQYFIFHRSSPSLPEGRYATFCDEKTIFFDEFDSPYKDPDGNAFIPIVQLKPEPVVATGWGYPMFSNIMPTQEMLDHSFSAIASNQAAFAVQSVLNPIGSDISVKNIGGLKFLNYQPQNIPGGGAPTALQLTQSAPETYKFIDLLLNHMQMVYNINSAMRGAPPPGVTSGTAIATLTTNGIEFAQNFIKAYIDSMETFMTYSMWNFANFANDEMLVDVEGPNRTTLIKTVRGSDFKSVRRVVCRVSNPLMSTAAGRFEIAQNLLNTGMLPDAQTYFDVLEGAPIETMYQTIQSENSLIHRENDDLRDAKEVRALWFDTHDKHILHHKSLTYDPEIRRNSPLLESILRHIDEHEALKAQAQQGPIPTIQAGGQPGGPMPPMPGQGGGGAQPAQPAEGNSDLTKMPLEAPLAG